MPEGEKIWGCRCGQNLPTLVGIGLTETPNSRWALAHPAQPLTASLNIDEKDLVQSDPEIDKDSDEETLMIQ